MTDNIIIFGAGASVDAGIPTLANFVEKMWELGVRGKNGNEILSEKDVEIFKNIAQIRSELNGYHGRASFNDKNIEDILSLLSFNLLDGDGKEKDKLNWMTKAISRTIELVSTSKFSIDEVEIPSHQGNEIYTSFWYKLIRRFKNSKSLPSILTFNYDLVLERSLFQLLFNNMYKMSPAQDKFPYDGIKLKYYYKLLEDYSYKIEYINSGGYKLNNKYIEYGNGTKLTEKQAEENQFFLDVEILKLHGSINFPKEKKNKNHIPTSAVEDANILPPLINKWAGENETEIWKTALQKLRKVKNIVIVGYSLPQTDIYLQNFIKAGIGPNLDLNKITVYNPLLFQENEFSRAMKERYSNCFSPQLRDKIVFTPNLKHTAGGGSINREDAGTFKHFVFTIEDHNSDIFF